MVELAVGEVVPVRRLLRIPAAGTVAGGGHPLLLPAGGEEALRDLLGRVGAVVDRVLEPVGLVVVEVLLLARRDLRAGRRLGAALLTIRHVAVQVVGHRRVGVVGVGGLLLIDLRQPIQSIPGHLHVHGHLVSGDDPARLVRRGHLVVRVVGEGRRLALRVRPALQVAVGQVGPEHLVRRVQVPVGVLRRSEALLS